MISFLAGKPNPETFPFASVDVELKPIEGQEPVKLTVQGKDLEEALQYTATPGLPRLTNFLETFQSTVHGRDKEKEGWRVSLGSGSQDSFTKAFYAASDPGDSILVESPTYPGLLGYLNAMPCDLVGIGSDSEGLRADLLEETLSNWPPGKKFPKIVYTMPVGANPSGTTASERRKADVLKVVKKYDLLLFEDDAYFYLYYGDEPQAKSYFALEREVNGETGRVIRFDSFSKILSSGIRLGYLTAPKAFCDKVDLITAATNLQVASFTQAVALQLFFHWGVEGLLQHSRRVALYYKTKRDMFERIARKHLDGLASWTTPTAGMFLWLDLKIPSQNSTELAQTKAIEAGVLFIPGASCIPSPGPGPTSSIRLSFSLANPQDTEEGFKRLAKLLKQENGLDK